MAGQAGETAVAQVGGITRDGAVSDRTGADTMDGSVQPQDELAGRLAGLQRTVGGGDLGK